MLNVQDKSDIELYESVAADRPIGYDEFLPFDSDLAIVGASDLYDFACPEIQKLARVASADELMEGAVGRAGEFAPATLERSAAARLSRSIAEVLCDPAKRALYDEYLLWVAGHSVCVQFLDPDRVPLSGEDRERAESALAVAVGDAYVARAIVAGFEQVNAPRNRPIEQLSAAGARAGDTLGAGGTPAGYQAESFHGGIGLNGFNRVGEKPVGAASAVPATADARRKTSSFGKKIGVIIVAVAACVLLGAVGLHLAGMSGADGSSTSAESSWSSASGDASGSAGSMSANPAGLPIDEESFPDKSFRKAVQSADDDDDGVLSSEEIAALEKLDLSDTDVESLEGLQLLDSVEELDISGCKRLEDVDFSMVPKLESLAAAGAVLSTADFSENASLSALKLDDSVVVTGLDATQLREQWQVVSYSQTGFNGDDPGEDALDSGEFSAAYTYNDDNTLARAEKREASENGGTQAVVDEFSYDDSGRFSYIARNIDGSFASEMQIIYGDSELSYEKTKQDGSRSSRRFLLDQSGRPYDMTRSGSDFSARYEYQDSEAGSLSRIVYHEQGREYSSDFDYEQGRIVESHIGGYSGGVQTYAYSYDDQGRCTKRSVTEMGSDSVVSEHSYSYDSDGLLQCDDVDLEYDKHGNVVKRTFGGSSDRTGSGEMSYRRIFTSKDAPDVFQPIDFGDPASAPYELLPVSFNLMKGQDPIAMHYGPYVLRSF